MMNAAYTFLAHSWAGLVIAAGIGGIGWILVRVARRPGRRWVRFLGYTVYVLAGLLTIASLVAIVRIVRASARYAPMGKLVDVGNYRMHILAEGEANGGPTLVWIPGGHAPGLALYHLHKILRKETRSILFDRPGTGWSDTGPLPRRTGLEAEELRTLLEKAGEKGPFVLIGHSYGGLLAANFARRHPDRTAALVLLDATMPDIFIYLPGGGGPNIPRGLVRGSRLAGWSKLFGLWSDPERKTAKLDKETARVVKSIEDSMADVREQIDVFNLRPASDWVSASLYSEWFDPVSVAEATVYDGELDEIPLTLVHPPDPGDPKVVEQQLGASPDALRRYRFLQRVRDQYLRTSKRSTLILTAPGTGHNFPYETPDFVVDVVRRVLAESRQR